MTDSHNFVNINSKLASEYNMVTCRLKLINADHNTPYPSAQFKFSEICEEEVITELRNLKATKSTGIDSIPACVLKISADHYCTIFNLVIGSVD
jgi:hypothetical protein